MLLCGLIVRKETKVEYVNPDIDIKPIPGVRYFMTENGGQKQSRLHELIAMIITFLLCATVPVLLTLTLIGWYSVTARGWIDRACLM